VVPIPYALQYKDKLRGQVPKLVPCEECGLEYVYLFQGSAEGTGTSALFLDNQGAQDRARAHAEAHLAVTLQQGVAVVPCPRCGRVQQNMVPLARSSRLVWLLLVVLALSLAVAVFGMWAAVCSLTAANRQEQAEALTAWIVVGALAVVAAGLFFLRRALNQRYDPNSAPVEERQRLGQELAVTKEEFLKLAAGETT